MLKIKLALVQAVTFLRTNVRITYNVGILKRRKEHTSGARISFSMEKQSLPHK